MPEASGTRHGARTGIAGSVGCSMGQVNPVDDGVCRHAPNGALIEKSLLLKPLPIRASPARSAVVSWSRQVRRSMRSMSRPLAWASV